MQIIIHSSKTMRPAPGKETTLSKPLLIEKASHLSKELRSLSIPELMKLMGISAKLAEQTATTIAEWTTKPAKQIAAIDSFRGDIYSGLQANAWTEHDKAFAQKHLRILSGLYGVLRPLDGISPYRLEMGYRFSTSDHKNLYDFWGNAIAKTFAPEEPIVNLSAVEYSKTITRYVTTELFTPTFYTVNPKTKLPTFVVVHTKIARGAFANWMIKHQIDTPADLQNFSDLQYHYDPSLSTDHEPAFVCKEFGGLGLSVRLTT